jgi:CBS-domain-containing membrane protein
MPAPPPVSSAPPAPLQQWAFDYGELDRAMAAVEETLRRTRHDLDRHTRGHEDAPSA